MEFSGYYRWVSPESLANEGEAKVSVESDSLSVVPSLGDSVVFSYGDIAEINDHDYQVDIVTVGGDVLVLQRLGYHYEDFLFQLYKLRNEYLLKNLLMQEALLSDQYYGQYQKTDSNQSGACEVRFYDSALLVLPQKADPIRLPYCFITQMSKGDYKLTVKSELGYDLVFSMFGGNFDPLVKALSDAYGVMINRTQESIRSIVPEVDAASLSKLSLLMKDGKAVAKKVIDRYVPSFWPRLTQRLLGSEIGEQLGFLSSLALEDEVCVGLKRGLMGDLTGQYTWLLFPFKVAGSGKIANMVALEAFTLQVQKEEPNKEDSQEPTADVVPEAVSVGATYFFRLMDPQKYSQIKSEALQGKFDEIIKTVNRCMVEVNFRREPIYLGEDQLQTPNYVQYGYAVSKLASLRTLRTLFIGRVVHSSMDKWKTEVKNISSLNKTEV